MEEIIISIDSDLLEKFEIALKLNGDKKERVLEEYIKQYSSDSFSRAAGHLRMSQTREKKREDEMNYGKAISRIPKWAMNPNQLNHKILRAFLQLEKEKHIVTYDDLENRCSDKVNHSDVYVQKFYGNYTSMKTDAANSHGKVFVENDSKIITIWETVDSAVRLYQHSFLR